MAVALLLCLAGTVRTELVTYAQEEEAGPLAVLYAQEPDTESQSYQTGDFGEWEEEGEEDGRREGESAVAEVHETLANVTLALVIFRVLGVGLASIVHHENLARAMIAGRKRP